MFCFTLQHKMLILYCLQRALTIHVAIVGCKTRHCTLYFILEYTNKLDLISLVYFYFKYYKEVMLLLEKYPHPQSPHATSLLFDI